MPTIKMHNSPLAFTYAQSLLELANDARQAAEVGQDLQALDSILQSQPVFVEYLTDPAVSSVDREQAIDHTFRGNVSPLLLNFLGVLNAHRRLKLLPQVIAAYGELFDEQVGNIDVDVTTAQRLSRDDEDLVRQRISQALGKNAIIHQYVDDSIIGGLVIRMNDQIIDASVRQQLESMRKQFVTASQKVRQ